jgi:hypothetical protein
MPVERTRQRIGIVVRSLLDVDRQAVKLEPRRRDAAR